MTGEPNNLLAGGTDNADLSSIDNPANLDFADSDDDQNTQEAQATAEIEDETDEGQSEQTNTDSEDDAQESEGAESADGDGENLETDGDQPEVKDDVIVTLRDGQKLPLSELKQGYLRQSDFTRKSQDLAGRRSALEDMTTRVQKSVDAIAEFLAKQMPAAPDPALSFTNPTLHYQQKVMFENAQQQLAQIIEQANAPKEVAKTLTAEQRKEQLDSENAKLAETFPQVSTPEGRKKFFDDAAGAAKELGYSDEDIMGVSDHRMFKLAHYARLGLAAEKAKAIAARKVEKAPPVTTPQRQQGKGAAQVKAQQDAMKRLSRTGSIHDAMRIDFD